MDWKYKYLVNQLHRTAYKKHESYVIGSLIHDTNLSELKPCTQYYVRKNDEGYALIDIYYPQIEIAIEVDESHHDRNRISDQKRQKLVEENLMCEFVRIDIKAGNVQKQIDNLKSRMLEKLKSYEEEGKWEPWVKPKTMDLEDAKRKFKKTLFLKIKGEIHPDDLMARQTGYWIIAKDKQKKVRQVVVVHNGIVSRVFKDIEWTKSEKDKRKVGYTGEEIDNGELVGTIIENWNFQSTKTYSNDVY